MTSPLGSIHYDPDYLGIAMCGDERSDNVLWSVASDLDLVTCTSCQAAAQPEQRRASVYSEAPEDTPEQRVSHQQASFHTPGFASWWYVGARQA